MEVDRWILTSHHCNSTSNYHGVRVAGVCYLDTCCSLIFCGFTSHFDSSELWRPQGAVRRQRERNTLLTALSDNVQQLLKLLPWVLTVLEAEDFDWRDGAWTEGWHDLKAVITHRCLSSWVEGAVCMWMKTSSTFKNKYIQPLVLAICVNVKGWPVVENLQFLVSLLYRCPALYVI